MRVVVLVAVMLVTACDAETSQPWDLVHDRIIAVRASAPALAAGETATIDVLVTTESGGPAEVAPARVELAPETPPDVVTIDGDRVTFDGDAGTLEEVTLVVAVELSGAPLVAIKAVRLGKEAENPVIDEVRADGIAVVDDAVAAPVGDVELAIDADEDDKIDWLTSIGELSDPDDALTTLTTEAAGAGQIVVVRRDPVGGVAWRVLAVAAE